MDSNLDVDLSAVDLSAIEMAATEKDRAADAAARARSTDARAVLTTRDMDTLVAFTLVPLPLLLLLLLLPALLLPLVLVDRSCDDCNPAEEENIDEDREDDEDAAAAANAGVLRGIAVASSLSEQAHFVQYPGRRPATSGRGCVDVVVCSRLPAPRSRGIMLVAIARRRVGL